jgi:maltooligosyltrehalose trehalohydrolase
VRDFFIENAQHWIHEYHIDGLRLDATHELHDSSEPHFLQELSARVRASAGRPVLLTAEDNRNDATLVRATDQGGYGLDAVWADDFHHQVRRFIAGDDEGYYADYTGSTGDIALTLNQGWYFAGQVPVRNRPRGTGTAGLRPEQFIICLQNHDQVGNRAFGERLHHEIDAAAYRAASALLLCTPHTPLLFMGQEWGASTPFCYFTDHTPELGRTVTEGRRAEFSEFRAFANEEVRAKIPDPQSALTFERSALCWPEHATGGHAALLRLYQRLLRLRRVEPALAADAPFAAVALDDSTILIRREPAEDAAILVAVRLRGAGCVRLDAVLGHSRWTPLLTTEEVDYTDDEAAPPLWNPEGISVTFARPSAIILRESRHDELSRSEQPRSDAR